MEETINHPSYYGGENNPYEAIKIIKALQLDFLLGNTVKYIARAGKKDKSKEIEDLKKAAWYLNEKIKELSERALVNTITTKEIRKNISELTNLYLSGSQKMKPTEWAKDILTDKELDEFVYLCINDLRYKHCNI